MKPLPTVLAAELFPSRPLVFVRHGVTQPNLDLLRCGGDLDLPMTDLGRAQLVQVARQLRAAAWPIDLIVASDLQRTREGALIIGEVLGGVPLEIDPAWRERGLGQWNLRPVAENDEALRAGRQPPGGESDAEFTARIERALRAFVSRTHTSMPLLVGSKGVGRVLGALLGARQAEPVANGQLLCFNLARLPDAVPRAHRAGYPEAMPDRHAGVTP